LEDWFGFVSSLVWVPTWTFPTCALPWLVSVALVPLTLATWIHGPLQFTVPLFTGSHTFGSGHLPHTALLVPLPGSLDLLPPHAHTFPHTYLAWFGPSWLSLPLHNTDTTHGLHTLVWFLPHTHSNLPSLRTVTNHTGCFLPHTHTVPPHSHSSHGWFSALPHTHTTLGLPTTSFTCLPHHHIPWFPHFLGLVDCPHTFYTHIHIHLATAPFHMVGLFLVLDTPLTSSSLPLWIIPLVPIPLDLVWIAVYTCQVSLPWFPMVSSIQALVPSSLAWTILFLLYNWFPVTILHRWFTVPSFPLDSSFGSHSTHH